VLRYTRLEPPERRAVQAAEDYRIWFLARLKAAANTLGLENDFPEKLVPYWHRLQQREGFKRALRAEQAEAGKN